MSEKVKLNNGNVIEHPVEIKRRETISKHKDKGWKDLPSKAKDDLLLALLIDAGYVDENGNIIGVS